MVTQTTAAETYDPIGDPKHAAYAADFVFRCSCGKRSSSITTECKQRHRAEKHEQYCMADGEVTLDVVQ